jgi:hypothetical protein
MAGCVICESDKEQIVARAENSQASFSAVDPLRQPICSLFCCAYLLICLPSSLALYNSIYYYYYYTTIKYLVASLALTQLHRMLKDITTLSLVQ